MKSKWRLSWGRHSWLEFISSPLRWSLNTSVEMLITERDASRYCRNTHTHTHWELSISELLIQKIWRYKSRAVNKPDLSIVIEPWPKPVTLPRIWGDERLSGCLLNMRADARRRVHLCCCLFLLMPCVTLRWISIKSKPWNEHILFFSLSLSLPPLSFADFKSVRTKFACCVDFDENPRGWERSRLHHLAS